MSKSKKASHRRLPPLLSVSPDGSGYASTRFTSSSPNPKTSRYHRNCCQPTRYQSPGPGSYLDALLRRPPNSRKAKSTRSTNSAARLRSHGCAQKVSEYLKKHLDFLERFVLENISLELLERWIIRKTQRQRKQAITNAETDEDTPSLSRWKFCVHADKREMLQELTSTLLIYPNKGHVLSQLARNVAAAVNASSWHLYIYNTETKELCSFENEDKNDKSLQLNDFLATQVVKTKENIRWKSPNKDFPNATPKIQTDIPVNVLCHPILQPDGELSGVLELYKDASNSEFHEEDEEIVNSYLVWGGIALHYAELFCNMIQQRELNSFLLTVVKSIFQDMVTMDTVILKIMMFARKLVSADRASLFLVDNRSGELYARIFDIHGSENEEEAETEKKENDLCPEEIRFPIGKGIAGYVAMTGESLNIPDAYNDSRFNRAVDQRTGYNTKNILCMPIFIRGNVIGVVQMVNKVGGSFTKNDEEAFATFASYCGLALHHAKLYDKIRRSEQKHKVALEILSYHNTCCEEEIKAIKSTKLPVAETVLKDFNFSTTLLTSDEKVVASIYMLTDLPQMGSAIKIDHDSLVRFTLTVRKNYRRVPYHNWTHGFSVANSVYTVIKESEKFKPLEELSLYVACLCHDLDHRGKTNQFLVNSASPLAAIYSTSVLEHHHFNMTVSILQQEGHNILRNLSSSEYKKVLNNIKHCILATDLALFFPNMAKLSEIVKENKFNWNIPEHRLLLQAITMTASDLCASTKSWDQQKEIVKVIFEEFYDQGDIEKSQGKQPVPIMDRNKMDEQPTSQVCFLKGICIPCYDLLHTLIPETKPMLDGCKSNLEKWQKLAEEQDVR